MMIRSCSSRPLRSRSLAAALTRGFWMLVMFIVLSQFLQGSPAVACRFRGSERRRPERHGGRSLQRAWSDEAEDPAQPADGSGDEDGVNDVEHAAQAGEPGAAVFALHVALEQGLGQV